MKKILFLIVPMAFVGCVNAGIMTNNPRLQPANITNPRLSNIQYIGTTPAAAMPLVAATQQGGFDYSGLITTIKTNVPIIISSIKILLPKVQQIATSASSGGFSGFVGGLVASAKDSDTRQAISNLATKVGETTSAVVAIRNSNDADAKSIAKNALAALVKDPEVQKLINVVRGVPLVGGMFADKLQALITDAVSL